MPVSLFLCLYLVGFGLPLTARKWSWLLGIVSFVSAIVTIAACLSVRADDGVAVTFLFPLICFGSGIVSGSVMSAIILTLRGDPASLRKDIVFIMSLSLVPLALVDFGAYREWAVAQVRLQIPDGQSAAKSQSCDLFETVADNGRQMFCGNGPL